MASSSGNSSGTTVTTTAGFLTSGSDDDDFTRLMNQRKRKRMKSNRESARRSRMRQQIQLDEMAATATRLTSENAHLVTRNAVVSRQLATVEAENSVLRAQLVELSRRLDSLGDILRWVEAGRSLGLVQVADYWFENHREWNSTCLPNQPIAASHGMFLC